MIIILLQIVIQGNISVHKNSIYFEAENKNYYGLEI